MSEKYCKHGKRKSYCKECVNQKRREHYQTHRDLEKSNSLVRYHINKQDPDFRKRRNARQRIFNADYMKRPEIREKQKVWSKTYRSKPNTHISRRLSYQVWFSLRHRLDGKKGKDGKHWQDLVGWSVEQLMAHLEAKFEPGMTWENYGGKSGWQIDHVVPRSWFNITSADCDEFRKCWTLDNLQPKWLSENASKGNRFAG